MKRPNFLIFVMDTQGVNNMSCYGYRRKTTPNIDKFAEEGVISENHFTPGVWTVPVHASLFTGKYVCGHGCDVGHEYLEDDFPTLAEVLNAYGYQTAAITNNGWIGTPTGPPTMITRGFLEYILVHQAEPVAPYIPPKDPDERDKGSWKTVGIVCKWLDEHAQEEKPFLLFINCIEPHTKYWPPQPFRRRFLLEWADESYARNISPSTSENFAITAGKRVISPDDWGIIKSLRDGETACLDHRMGLIFDYLREKDILDNTVVFILGDHGDTVGEHYPHTSHCQTAIWDTMLHTPLIVHGPDYFPSNQRIKNLVQTVDIFPTILEIAGIDDRNIWKEVEGKSLLAALNKPIREFAMAELEKPTEPFALMLRWGPPKWDPRTINRRLKCARTLEYKYVWSSDGRDEMYNIVEDPDEQKNIILERPEVAEDLRKKMENFLLSIDRRDYGDYVNSAWLNIPSDILARLKAWGLIRDIIGARRQS